MRAYVTGGSGAIGRRLVADLRRKGLAVSCLVRDPARCADLFGAQLIRGDILDAKRLAETIPGHDLVFHLAGYFAIGVLTRRGGADGPGQHRGNAQRIASRLAGRCYPDCALQLDRRPGIERTAGCARDRAPPSTMVASTVPTSGPSIKGIWWPAPWQPGVRRW